MSSSDIRGAEALKPYITSKMWHALKQENQVRGYTPQQYQGHKKISTVGATELVRFEGKYKQVCGYAWQQKAYCRSRMRKSHGLSPEECPELCRTSLEYCARVDADYEKSLFYFLIPSTRGRRNKRAGAKKPIMSAQALISMSCEIPLAHHTLWKVKTLAKWESLHKIFNNMNTQCTKVSSCQLYMFVHSTCSC